MSHAVDADKRRKLVAVGICDFHYTAEVAGIFEHLLVLLGELHTAELLRQVRLGSDEVRLNCHISVRIGLERETSVDVELLTEIIGVECHELRLSVVEHFREVFRVDCIFVDAPFLLDVAPVYFAFINSR